jgi:hypothetical protein
MKLVFPHTGEMRAADARLLRLAQFLGITCESLRLDGLVRQHAEYIEKVIPDRNSCLVVNPQVMREWVGGDSLPDDLASCLAGHFPRLVVHAVALDPSVDGILASLSAGGLSSVRPVADSGQPYQILTDPENFCGPFAGLSFGPVKPANDRIFAAKVGNNTVRNLICIGGRPFMVSLRRDATEMFCIAAEDVTDINAHAGYAPVNQHFSRFMPHAMALRYIFREECWLPGESHACIIVDDPLLRPNYGFLNFETLLHLMKEHNFHTTVAFIPHNYRRNSKRTLRIFKENTDYFSICYHGNDHTQSEFASHDTDFLNAALAIAEERMRSHDQATGLHCDRVMVFPGSDFSVEAMQVLKSRNFYAAVTSAWHPLGQESLPSVAQICQPAILRFGGFPLFGRNSARETRSQDVAFNVFFGKPTLTGEHHDSFENPYYLVEGVQRINAVTPGISWSNLETAVGRSFLRRRAADGSIEVKAYSSSVSIANDSESVQRFSILWGQPEQHPPFEHVLRDGAAFTGVEVEGAGLCVRTELAPGTCHTFSVFYRNGRAAVRSLGLRWNTKAFLRRRLSEVRDNYLSKNRHVLSLAKTLQRRLLSRGVT